MKDSGLAWVKDIPNHWRVMPNKYVMYKVKDIQDIYKGEDIISLSMDGVKVRDLDAGGKMPTSFDGYQKIKPGRLLMCLFDIDVTPRCIGIINDEGLTSPAYSQFVLRDVGYAPYYYYYYLCLDNDKTLVYLAKNLRHSLTEDQLGAISVPVPPIEEQQAIADYLDTQTAKIDAAINEAKELIEKYKAYKQSVITEAVTKGLNPNVQMKDSGIDWIGEIPEHWDIDRLKNCVSEVVGGVWGIDEKDDGTDTICYRIADFDYRTMSISKDKITYRNYGQELKENKLLKVGDLLLEKSGGGEKFPVGRVVLYQHEDEKATCSNFVQIVRIEKKYKPKFMCYSLFSSYAKGISWLCLNQTTGIQNLRTELFFSIKYALPPLCEQISIINYLDSKCSKIDAIISQKEQLITQLQEYKKSIIFEYVTGKKEVPNG